MKFELGELLMIYDAVSDLPKGYKLRSGQMKNGVRFQEVHKNDLLLKIKNHTEHLQSD